MFLLLFWGGLAGAIHAYFGYPALLWIWARIRPVPLETGADDSLPTATILLPVHNEEANIGARLQNLVELDIPPSRTSILVISDGSTDATVEIAREVAERHPHIHVLELAQRGGKAGGLNAGLERATGEVVVFTDAGIRVEPGSLTALLEPFADPAVGCTSGEDRVEEAGGEGLYGRYELSLRRMESRVSSIVGASGSWYAQRRSLCQPFPEGIAPDFLSVLRTVEMGYRAINVPEARGTMGAARSHGAEFRRKVRTLVRGMAGLSSHAALLNPFRSGSYAFVLLSHKVLRWMVPGFLLLMAVGHLGLAGRTPYTELLWLHGGFYLLAVVGLLGVPGISRWLPVRVAAYFVAVNAAVLVALWKFTTGHRQEIWTPTSRA